MRHPIRFFFSPTSFCLTRRTRIESSPSVSHTYVHTYLHNSNFVLVCARSSLASLSLISLPIASHYPSLLDCLAQSNVISLSLSLDHSHLLFPIFLFPISHFPISLFQYCCMHASLSCLVFPSLLDSPLQIFSVSQSQYSVPKSQIPSV